MNEDFEDEPQTLAELVDDLLCAAKDPTDSYPVVVTTTKSYIVWMEAESTEDAHRRLSDDGCWYEHISSETLVLYEDVDIALPDASDWRFLYSGQEAKNGPWPQCPQCLTVQHGGHGQHRLDCPVTASRRAELERKRLNRLP